MIDNVGMVDNVVPEMDNIANSLDNTSNIVDNLPNTLDNGKSNPINGVSDSTIINNLSDEMPPDEAMRYEKYWRDLTNEGNKKAPVQNAPYSIYNKYTSSGELYQVTTYDKYGSRCVQYDLFSMRFGPHYHPWIYSNIYPRPNGLRYKYHDMKLNQIK
jgi:hypothetical protein